MKLPLTKALSLKTIVAVVVATFSFQYASAQFTLSCDSFCVVNVEMDTSGNLAVTIRNNNAGHVNYPTLQVLDTNGDTLAGDTMLNFFAHLGQGVELTYIVPTVLDSVPDGFAATVALFDGLDSILCLLPYPCSGIINQVEKSTEADGLVFPVPARDLLTVQMNQTGLSLRLYDACGRCVVQRHHASRTEHLDVRGLPSGIYWLCIDQNDSTTVVRKVALMHPN